MKVEKQIYNYVNFELQSYAEYKRLLSEMRDDILFGSPRRDFVGISGKGTLQDSTGEKAIKLAEPSVALWSMERLVRVVDHTLRELGGDYPEVFEEIYIRGNHNLISVGDKLGMSEETVRRRKQAIIYSVGYRLGAIKSIKH